MVVFRRDTNLIGYKGIQTADCKELATVGTYPQLKKTDVYGQSPYGEKHSEANQHHVLNA